MVKVLENLTIFLFLYIICIVNYLLIIHSMMHKLSYENIWENVEYDSLEIKKSLYSVFSHYEKSKEDKFRSKYKWNKYAMKQLAQAKQFWKYFSEIKFWSSNYVNELKEHYKGNEYVLEMINKFSQSVLNPAFCRPLRRANVELYSNIAKKMVDQALLQKKTAIITERPIISIKLDDNLVIPFYISTWEWGKLWVKTDKFYPFFWISTDDWYFNKWHQSDINNYYWMPLFAAIAIELNTRYKNNEINPYFWPKLSKCELVGRNIVYHEDYKNFVAYTNLWKQPDDHDQHEGIENNINTTLKKIEWDRVDVANNIKLWWKYFFESIKNFIKEWKKNDVISLVNRLFDKLYYNYSADEFRRHVIFLYGELIKLWYENIKNWAKEGMISPKVEKAAEIYRSKVKIN